MKDTDPKSPTGPATLEERVLRRLEREHPDGLSSAQIVDAFTEGGVRLSEATFRKWVQLGLLPRSRRVGRKGKHQGSRGVYPASTLRRINEIKRLMLENLTIEEIQQSLQYRDQIESLERGLDELLAAFVVAAAHSALPATERAAVDKGIADARRVGADLAERLVAVERRIVTPLERAARQRAFGTGSSGGADELL